jgi:hypothetical protein
MTARANINMLIADAKTDPQKVRPRLESLLALARSSQGAAAAHARQRLSQEVLHAAVSDAQATIAGCATDKRGGVLPGVDVVATSASSQTKAVTDPSGCYRLSGIRAGTYSVTVALAGFATGKREGIVVASGGSVDHVDFSLCLGGLEEIDWVVPGGLAEAWKQSTVVAYVRVVGTRPVRSDCHPNDVLHTAVVIEMFKESLTTRIGATLTFRQENWASERTPYAIGQKMFVFLTATQQPLWRLAGPYYVFLVNGDQIVSFHSSIKTHGTTPTDFAAKLRALAKGQDVP